MGLLQSLLGTTYSSGLPTKPRERACCRSPVMATASVASQRPILLWMGFGILISSFANPFSLKLFSARPSSMNRGCVGCLVRLGPPWLSLSNDPRMSIRRGSSSSASCSARSPVSLKNEKSEPAESEERRRCFSFSSNSECSSDWRAGGTRVLRGMFEGFFEEGMVTVELGGLISPL